MRATGVSFWKLPAVSGFLYFMAFYSGLLVPNLLMFLPLLLWLDLDERAPRLRRLWAGFVFGLAAYVPGLHFHYAMAEISWLAWMLYAGLVVAFSLKCAAAVALLGWLRRRLRWSWALLLPLTWIPVEWLATWGDLKMTADHSGQSLAAFPFVVQFADLFGAYGVGAALLAWNGMLYEALYGFYRDSRRRAALGLVLLAAAVLGYDAWAWRRTEAWTATDPTLRVAFVQPNIPLQVKHATHTALEQWRILERQTREAARLGAEVVIWPESSRPWPLLHELDRPDSYSLPEVGALARGLGISIVVGAEYWRIRPGEPADLFNAALLVHPDGTLDPHWGAKVYLVPFTEGIPLRPLLEPLVEGRGGEWQWLEGGFDPGPSWALLPLGGGPEPTILGVEVCYEQLFYEPARWLKNHGAAFQAVITNDAWFGRTPFQRLQRDVLRMRAIENRTSFVRVANTGYSGFVDPLGRYRESTRLFEEAVGVRDVTLDTRRTLYDRTGNSLAWISLAGLIVAAATARLKRGAAPR